MVRGGLELASDIVTSVPFAWVEGCIVGKAMGRSSADLATSASKRGMSARVAATKANGSLRRFHQKFATHTCGIKQEGQNSKPQTQEWKQADTQANTQANNIDSTCLQHLALKPRAGSTSGMGSPVRHRRPGWARQGQSCGATK